MLSSSSSSSGSSSTKKARPDPGPDKSPPAHNRWKSPGQQRIYNRRLLDALRNPRPANSAAAVKEAADSALAMTAHGQSRWSRAILASRRLPRRRVLIKAAAKKKKKVKKVNEEPPTKDEKVNDRLRKLGRLVPGCRKLAAPSMLEEAADYLAALQMQVRTMRMLADAMSAAALTSNSEEMEPDHQAAS